MNTDKFKEALLKEKVDLESELGSIGFEDKEHTGDWKPAPSDRSEADYRDEIADRLEELQEKEASESILEKRYRNVLTALKKIEDGNYGMCEKGDHPIEEDRLNANPAALTCKEHMNDEN